ncbi:hypothetical protein Tco_0304641 [Tanacetum coccineum]
MVGLPPRAIRNLWLRYEGPLVREFMLEFFSTCKINDTEMGLDTADNLCFQLGGARCSMTRRQFILALGLHTAEEMAGDGFEVNTYDSNLFYLRSMDEGTAINVPYLLAQYLFRHAEGRKRGSRLSGRHFVRRLAEHFGYLCKGMRGPERQQATVARALEDVEGVYAEDKGRMARLEEEVHGLRESLDKQQEVMDVIARDFSRFTVWAASGISQLLDLSGATYMRYSETHVSYQWRRAR